MIAANFIRRGSPAAQKTAANGRANTTLAPKLFGSPCELSTPMSRMMPMR